jgi:hypothetical protein
VLHLNLVTSLSCHPLPQGSVQHLIFSGAHPGGGLRNVSEANAMEDYALHIAGGQPVPGRCVCVCFYVWVCVRKGWWRVHS